MIPPIFVVIGFVFCAVVLCVVYTAMKRRKRNNRYDVHIQTITWGLNTFLDCIAMHKLTCMVTIVFLHVLSQFCEHRAFAHAPCLLTDTTGTDTTGTDTTGTIY